MNNKTLNECSREELLEVIKSLKKQKKFGLVWEDKPEKVATECRRKLPVIKEEANKAIVGADMEEPTNLIIKGDNYHALSVLNYTHAGKIDVIYIDPPYNTGNKDFTYNDRYIDTEDDFRHSKWLSFMQKRLALARQLLKDDGVIFISIDDNEQAHLRLLCDEIFGEQNFITQFIWRRSGTGGLRGLFPVTTHEYILAYAKNITCISEKWTAPYSKLSNMAFKNSDERGLFKTQALYLTSLKQTDTQSYFIELPDKTMARPPIEKGAWRYVEETYKNELAAGNIIFKKTKNSPLVLSNGNNAQYNIYTKQYMSDEGSNPASILPEEQVRQTRAARAELKNLFKEDVFNYAKPSALVKYLIQLVNKPHDISILDFFAGSGTTGQAVIELNSEDDGHRQFILCTDNENNIAEEVTYPRIKTVITGKRKDGSIYSNGIRTNLRYFKTDFVEKDETLDKLRRKLSPACEDMIRIREGAFNKVIDEDKFKVYKNSRGLTAVVFDRFELTDYIARIEELETDAPVHLYVFSYTNYGRLDELSDDLKHTYESQPIPEGVLEIYKRIFNKGGKR